MNCSKAELIEVIRDQVLFRKSTIYTDGWRAYDGLVLEGYKHVASWPRQRQFTTSSKSTV